MLEMMEENRMCESPIKTADSRETRNKPGKCETIMESVKNFWNYIESVYTTENSSNDLGSD
jgi:hypothetical protein